MVKDLDNSIVAIKLNECAIYRKNLVSALSCYWRKPSDLSTGIFSVTQREAHDIVLSLVTNKNPCTSERKEVSMFTVTEEINNDLKHLGWFQNVNSKKDGVRL